VASLVSLIATVAYFLLLLYFFVMWGRFIVDLVRTFHRRWRPQSIGLVLIELMYTITDPPIRFFRRIFPPATIGNIALDFGWSLTMLCVIVLMTLVSLVR
jgi:YggT family protein